MTITSTVIQEGEHIPEPYSYDGKNINPPLTFSEVPVEAQSLALIMEDPDAPGGIFTHWLLYDMSPATLQIMEGETPMTATLGINDFGDNGYGGPKPPSGTHRYVFKLFALDARLDLGAGKNREEVYAAMKGRVVDTAELVGTYAA